MQCSLFTQLLSSYVLNTVSPRFVFHKAVERERVRAYVKSQKQAIHVTLKCANNCSGWLVPPVWCHPTDERLLAAVRMYAVLSVNASQRSAFDSLPGGKHIISGREPDLLNFHQLAVIRIHPEVVGFPQPLPFFLSVSHRILFGGFAVFLFLTRRWQRNQGGKLLKNQTQSPFLGAGFVATGHEFGGTDGYMVDHARGAGIAEEDHLGSWSVSPEFLERWGGFVQTVGASQPGVHGESKGIKTPPSLLSLRIQPTARPVGASVRCRSVKTDAVCCLASLSAHWPMRRFSFVGHGSPGYCLRKQRYMLTQTCAKRMVFPLRIDPV